MTEADLERTDKKADTAEQYVRYTDFLILIINNILYNNDAIYCTSV